MRCKVYLSSISLRVVFWCGECLFHQVVVWSPARAARERAYAVFFTFLGLGEEYGVDVREHAAARDCHAAEQLVEFLVVTHRQLQVAGNDARLLLVAGRVAGELEDLRAQVLHDRREVHGRARADAGRVLALLEVAADAAYGKLQPRLRGLGYGLARRLASAAAALAALSFALHDDG
jgi:hypothetical protein